MFWILLFEFMLDLETNKQKTLQNNIPEIILMMGSDKCGVGDGQKKLNILSQSLRFKICDELQIDFTIREKSCINHAVKPNSLLKQNSKRVTEM